MSLKQREARIRRCAEKIEKCGLEIGEELIAIETEKDWQETEYGSFDAYLQGEAETLTGKSYNQCRALMKAMSVKSTLDVQSGFGASQFQELARLAPTVHDETGGRKKQITKQDAKVMEKAAKRAQEIAEEKNDERDKPKPNVTPSVRDVREAVRELQDAKAGVNREQRQAANQHADAQTAKLDYLAKLASHKAKMHSMKRLMDDANVSLIKLAKTRETIELMDAWWGEILEQVAIYHPSIMEEVE